MIPALLATAAAALILAAVAVAVASLVRLGGSR